MKTILRDLVLIILMFLAYDYVTSPDTNVIKNISFGSELIIIVGKVFIVILLGMVVRFMERLWYKSNDIEDKLVERATTPEAASRVLLANALTRFGYLLSGAIIFAF